MKTHQYTIRNIPQHVDTYLRKVSAQSGKSLNQVVIDELAERVAPSTDPVGSALSWFIGSGIDDETLAALADEDIAQKAFLARELD